MRQSISVNFTSMFGTVAPSALDPVDVVLSTPSRAWLLTNGPSGLQSAQSQRARPTLRAKRVATVNEQNLESQTAFNRDRPD